MQQPADDDDVLHEPVVAPLPPPHAPPWWAPLTLVAFLGLVVCTNIANVVWARWANTNPEGLIALSSRQRYLVLAVAGGISPFWYVVIGGTRIAAAFVVCHLVGRAYRDQALSVVHRYLGMSRSSIDTFNNGFAKAEIALVPFFAGSNIVGVLTGIHRTPRRAWPCCSGSGSPVASSSCGCSPRRSRSSSSTSSASSSATSGGRSGISLVAVVAVNARNFRRGAGS